MMTLIEANKVVEGISKRCEPKALDVNKIDWKRAPRADVTEWHDRLKLGSINEYSNSILLVDLTVRPERVRIGASSGFCTNNVPSSESCSFICKFALSSNALGSRGRPLTKGLKDDRDGLYIFD